MNNLSTVYSDPIQGWQCTFLGTGDSLGVPRVYCDCEVCVEARSTGGNRRLRSAVLVHQGERQLMIDCGPDWTTQMEMNGLRWVSEIIITHAHYDHIAGLPAYADACRWLQRKGSVRAPQEVLDQIIRMYPWLVSTIEFSAIESNWQWYDWRIIPGKVNHGKNGYSYAYRFERASIEGSYNWIYASDAINLNEEELKLFRNVNTLVLGTSYYHEPYSYETRSIYDMVEALELLNTLQPQNTIFTHMSHDVDCRKSYPLPPHVQLADTGLTINV